MLGKYILYAAKVYTFAFFMIKAVLLRSYFKDNHHAQPHWDKQESL